MIGVIFWSMAAVVAVEAVALAVIMPLWTHRVLNHIKNPEFRR